nr:MAG TPA: hypothetical protein [Caudoviricetes sp.]
MFRHMILSYKDIVSSSMRIEEVPLENCMDFVNPCEEVVRKRIA